MLFEKIKEITNGVYPFHMPGHKRNPKWIGGLDAADITEVFGADNLHSPEGIIAESEASAASLYKTKKTFLLTGGSTCGILSAVSAVCEYYDKIIIARNCHRSVYNAAVVNRLDVTFVYPEPNLTLGCFGAVSPQDVGEEMDKSGAKTVIITSPTYEGTVSDVEGIAKEVHLRDGILIVDSSHGAHLGFSSCFPTSARELGADIVIESAHKTLPCLTGAALLHLCSDRTSVSALRKAIGIYLTSSPPYPILCSLDRFIANTEKPTLFDDYVKRLEAFYKASTALKSLKIIKPDDPSKIIISCAQADINGFELKERLLKEYKIELEMAMPNYALAMTSIADTDEGFARLLSALLEIDKITPQVNAKFSVFPPKATKKTSLFYEKKGRIRLVSQIRAVGKVSAEFIYAYPPGSPIIATGEEFSTEHFDYLRSLSSLGGQICSTVGNFPENVAVLEDKD